MLPKALASGADIVCADLEDAVAPNLKADARPHGLAFLADGGSGPERALRLNPLRSREGVRDVQTLLEQPPIASGLLALTKVEHPEEVAMIDTLLSEHGSSLHLILLIETVRGLDAAKEIAAASSRNAILLFGAVDLAAELGVPVEHEPLLYARSRTVHAARMAGIGVLDVPCLDFRNLAMVEQESLGARKLGFTGKAVLHPSNVAVVNRSFMPTEHEIAQATAVLEAFASSPTGLGVLDGKLIEKPVARAAEQVLARAKAIGQQVD